MVQYKDKMELNKIYNEDCQEGIKRIPDASIDCVLTDPPYLYLKNQKLDRPFDEQKLFCEFVRVLKSTGFVIMFGRGVSFYRWNTMLADLGFTFKEEIIWDKQYSSSPVTPISRKHETIAIFCKGDKGINKVRIPYLEGKNFNVEDISQDIKRLKPLLNNLKELEAVTDFFKTGNVYNDNVRERPSITVRGDLKKVNVPSMVVRMIRDGLLEKSIISIPHERYSRIHPTQKPARLLERLLALVTKPGDVVLDPFAGSCSTAVACINTGRKFIGFEIDSEYYEAGTKRLNEALSEPKLAM